MFSFDSPFYLIGIPFTFAVAYWLKRQYDKKQEKKAFIIANFAVLQEAAAEKKTQIDWLKYLPFLQIAAICFLFLALSQPKVFLKQFTNSVQVILALDTSKSMMATDFNPNRLVAARRAAEQFLQTAPRNIKIGLIFFHGNASLVVPLTNNRHSLRNTLQGLSLNKLGNGTAIGEAVSLAGKSFEAGSEKHLIVLTDGENNSGVDPFEALNDLNQVKIYTVGIGDPLGATVKGGLITKLDSDTLIELAHSTGGEYFEVSSSQSELDSVYRSLGKAYSWQKVQTSLWPLCALISLIATAFSFAVAWMKLQ